MITQYDMSLSGNCHKVRLLLTLLVLSYQSQPVNSDGDEQCSPDYLQRIRALPGKIKMAGMWQAYLTHLSLTETYHDPRNQSPCTPL